VDPLFARSISGKSLKTQCKELGVSYSEVSSTEKGKPEKIVLDILEKNGWNGSNCEGYTIKHLVKAAALTGICRDAEYKGNTSHYVLGQFLESHFICSGYAVSHLKREVLKTPRFKIHYRYSRISKASTPSDVASGRVAMKFFNALGRESIYKLLEMYGRYNFDIRAGWPDLTVVKDNIIRLIEVKKRDRLHLSQIQTIPELKKCLPRNATIEIIRVRS
jgi:hypothetical protein